MLISDASREMDVSCALKLRGGIAGFSEFGWYADAVCSWRLPPGV